MKKSLVRKFRILAQRPLRIFDRFTPTIVDALTPACTKPRIRTMLEIIRGVLRFGTPRFTDLAAAIAPPGRFEATLDRLSCHFSKHTDYETQAKLPRENRLGNAATAALNAVARALLSDPRLPLTTYGNRILVVADPTALSKRSRGARKPLIKRAGRNFMEYAGVVHDGI